MMTAVIESDHVMYLFVCVKYMGFDLFFLVLIYFFIDDSLQSGAKTNKKAVLWQENRTYDAVVKLDPYRNFTAA